MLIIFFGNVFRRFDIIFSFEAMIVAALYAAFNTSFYNFFKSRSFINKILSTLGTIGTLYFYLSKFGPLETLTNNLIFYITLSILLTPFIMVMFSKIYSYLGTALVKIEEDITRSNETTISVIVILLTILLIFTFLKADAFYSFQKLDVDIVYSADTLSLLRHNAWMNIYHEENDIRQPFFAIFTAPFVAPIYGITCWLENAADMIIPFAIGISNIVLLVMSAYIISTLIEQGSRRIGFTIFFLSTFAPLLFSITLEQYVPTLFWIVILIYMYVNNIEHREIAYTAATGMLITNGILLPLVCNIKDNFKTKISKIINTISVAFLTLFMFARTDILLMFYLRLRYLMQFSGKSIPLLQKVIQYTHFIPNCFAAINDGPIIGKYWKLTELTKVNYIGIIILLICFISFIFNRKDKLSRICWGWILFSFLILVIIGWGTKENGLVLYSLYFSWAFIILIYKFIKMIFERIKKEHFMNVTVIILSIPLLIYNLYDLIKMINYLSQF